MPRDESVSESVSKAIMRPFANGTMVLLPMLGFSSCGKECQNAS